MIRPRTILPGLVCFVLLAALRPLAAQVPLQGRVVDAESGVPLPLAHVLIEGTYTGTATNQAGTFVLTVDALPVDLRVGSLGYAQHTLNVTSADVPLLVLLSPVVLELDELIVAGDEADRLVERAFERCKARRSNLVRGKAFYRQLSRSDSIYTEMIEAFFDAAVSCDGVLGWTMEHGRYALHEDYVKEDYVYHHDFSSLTRRLPLIQTRRDPVWHAYLPLRKNASKRFLFSLQGRTLLHDRPVAVVRFTPTSRRRAGFEGTLYIDEETFAVYRMEATIGHRRFQPLRARDSYTRVLFDQAFRIEWGFRPLTAEFVVPSYVRLSATYNHVKRRFNRKVQAESVLLFYDYAPEARLGSMTHRRTDFVADYEWIDRQPYDPAFWAGHAVLAENPTEAEVRRAFEEAGSFGTVFGGKPKPR